MPLRGSPLGNPAGLAPPVPPGSSHRGSHTRSQHVHPSLNILLGPRTSPPETQPSRLGDLDNVLDYAPSHYPHVITRGNFQAVLRRPKTIITRSGKLYSIILYMLLMVITGCSARGTGTSSGTHTMRLISTEVIVRPAGITAYATSNNNLVTKRTIHPTVPALTHPQQGS